MPLTAPLRWNSPCLPRTWSLLLASGSAGELLAASVCGGLGWKTIGELLPELALLAAWGELSISGLACTRCTSGGPSLSVSAELPSGPGPGGSESSEELHKSMAGLLAASEATCRGSAWLATFRCWKASVSSSAADPVSAHARWLAWCLLRRPSAYLQALAVCSGPVLCGFLPSVLEELWLPEVPAGLDSVPSADQSVRSHVVTWTSVIAVLEGLCSL